MKDDPRFSDVVSAPGPAPEQVRALSAVAADAPLREVLALMQRDGTHLGRVVDGPRERTVGVVALEDVLEELVGEVQDAARRG